MQRDPRIVAICFALIEEIPDPYKPPPKPQKSWQTLEVGRELRALDSLETLVVVSCDSQGVTAERPDKSRLRIEDRDWRSKWEKVRKKPQRKKAKES